MKKYIKNNVIPLLIGYCAATTLQNVYNLVEAIILKIVLIINN